MIGITAARIEELLPLRARLRSLGTIDEQTERRDHQHNRQIHLAHQEICPKNRSHPYYTAAIPGGAHPLDSTQANVVRGSAPYWRLAYEQRWDRNSLSVDAFGLNANVHPGNGTALAGGLDKFRDTAVDMQYQFIGEDHLVTFLGTYIREHQTLNASVLDGFAANTKNNLKTLKLTGEYYYQRRIGGTIGYFSTTGSSDSLLYVPGPVTGSATSNPDTNGYVLEVNYLPWLNTKLQAQYCRLWNKHIRVRRRLRRR